MKSLKQSVVPLAGPSPFQIHRLGLHEVMKPGLVHRPGGTGDYLFMYFHTEIRIRLGAKDLVYPPASFMIWTPRDGHFYGNEALAWNHSWFHAAGRDISRILKAGRVPVGQPFTVTDPSLLERYLLETVAELNGWRGPDPVILRNLFENFVRTLARHLFDKPGRLAPEALLKVKRHLDQHFRETFRLRDLARQAGWSAPHFCTEFKRYFGIPVIRYIQQLRMNQAVYLLRDYNRSIGEIAGLVGYPDLYTFSKMFKRSLGVSPRNFRALNTRR